MPVNVVLVQPEIAPNVGNVARTCACVGAWLHLIHPLGFDLEDPRFRRAVMDYWDQERVVHHNSFDALYAASPGRRFFFTISQGQTSYREIAYKPGDFLVFGQESHGLPDAVLEHYRGTKVGIPMRPAYRSLNLASSVAIILYEAAGQLGFPGCE